VIAFRGLTHVLFALNIALALHTPTIWLPLVGFGAILPDIDCRFSPIGSEFQGIGFIFGKHRTMTHSLFATVLVFALNPAIGFGYLTHIAVDLLNPTGCQLFFPLHKWVRIGIVRSGGVGEWFIKMGLIGGVFYNVLARV
jgi:membrane-bound metal-dependent hydrolase YbcI (DUF457 family)